MSCDVSLEADLGGDEPVMLGILDANYTYNVRPLFHRALGDEGFCSDWDGLSASEAMARCDRTLAAFDAEPLAYEALNPTNGWGDFYGARRFIETIRQACARAPLATLRVC